MKTQHVRAVAVQVHRMVDELHAKISQADIAVPSTATTRIDQFRNFLTDVRTATLTVSGSGWFLNSNQCFVHCVPLCRICMGADGASGRRHFPPNHALPRFGSSRCCFAGSSLRVAEKSHRVSVLNQYYEYADGMCNSLREEFRHYSEERRARHEYIMTVLLTVFVGTEVCHLTIADETWQHFVC